MEIRTITLRLPDIKKENGTLRVDVFINDWERIFNFPVDAEMLAKPVFVEGAAGEFIPDLIDAINQKVLEEGE